MSAATLSRWTRRFLLVGIAWFVCWQLAVATGGGRRVAVALLGFLGLAIVGVSFQFYPPSIASIPGVGDRTATMSAALLVAGLVVEVGSHLADQQSVVDAGSWVAVLGAVLYASVLVTVFTER